MSRAHPLSSRRAEKLAFEGLTTREREIAALIARGKYNREIADELVLSERTVETHVSNIMLKLGFTSRRQIVLWAIKKRSNSRKVETVGFSTPSSNFLRTILAKPEYFSTMTQ